MTNCNCGPTRDAEKSGARGKGGRKQESESRGKGETQQESESRGKGGRKQESESRGKGETRQKSEAPGKGGKQEKAAVKTAAELQERVAGHLEAARAGLEALLGVRGARTVENSLVLYGQILVHLDAAGCEPGLLERVHPEAPVRTAAEEATRAVDKFATALSLDRNVYEALKAIDASGQDGATQYFLARTLRDYRRAGVDRDDATRQRVQELREELTRIGQDFERNIQSDTRSIRVEPAALDGLPDDYVRSHAPGADGLVTVTTDYPDYVPFMAYSRREAARRQLYLEFRRRGHPKNIEVLDRMLAKRYELAGLLGYASWAHYATEDKMIGSEAAARTFIDRIATIASDRAERDYAALLAAKRRDDPTATVVADWEKEYYERIVKSTDYAFDPQTVRPYFAYENVKQGVLDLTGRLFGIEYRRVSAVSPKGAASTTRSWSSDVETYDVYEGDTRLGRFHLDMHPRADKFKHAAQFTLVHGVAGRQLPEAALVCNFPRPGPDDPGLLEHDDVETFLHEFGHLLHTIFAGKQRWVGISGISTEWDFVEAPSQMLEEWARDATVLQTFAVHHETGEKIPDELVTRLRRANEFGKGTFVRQQMFYAALALGLHDRDPQGLDATRFVREMQRRYSMYDYVDDTYFHLSFGHLEGYSALYYTYMWSLVIAKDLFSNFDRSNLFNPAIAKAYREAVLAPGGSAPAERLVQDFLGRPFGFEAYQEWIDAE